MKRKTSRRFKHAVRIVREKLRLKEELNDLDKLTLEIMKELKVKV